MALGHRPGTFSTSDLVTRGRRAANDDEFPIVSSLAPHRHLVDRELSHVFRAPRMAALHTEPFRSESIFVFFSKRVAQTYETVIANDRRT